jgi:hypothetical protein
VERTGENRDLMKSNVRAGSARSFEKVEQIFHVPVLSLTRGALAQNQSRMVK